VPAKSLELTPADAIFVRMGARDSIVSGQVSSQLLAILFF
jgi:DNA mismatch repair ATPase MutS